MTQVNQLVLGRTILDSVIRDVVNQRIDDYEKLAQTLRQVKILLIENNYFIVLFFLKFVEGGVDMGTSTGDVGPNSQLNTERSGSGQGELIVTTENARDGGETNMSALPTGNILFY